jgi:type I restriction enzyme M protein
VADLLQSDYKQSDYGKVILPVAGYGNLIPQTIEEYFEPKVKPHLPKTWIDRNKTKTGYEINFTKYFYKFKTLHPPTEIKADILTLEESSLKLEKTVDYADSQ